MSKADFGQRLETVDWSQARYASVAADVVPAPAGTLAPPGCLRA